MRVILPGWLLLLLLPAGTVSGLRLFSPLDGLRSGMGSASSGIAPWCQPNSVDVPQTAVRSLHTPETVNFQPVRNKISRATGIVPPSEAMIIHRGARGACWPLVGVFLAVWLDPMHGIRTRGSPASRLLFALRDGATAGRPRPRDHRDPRQCPHSARNALACPGALRQRYKSVHLHMVLSEGEEYGNPNAGGAGFKRLSGKRRVVDPQKREVEWQEWLDSLSPEERATVEENERLTPLNAHEWNVTERAREKGCGFFDENGKFIEGAAGRSTVWDKDPDNRWILHQCPISELPAAILDKDRFLHQHPGWFRDRSVFESVYLGMVKKKLDESLSDFEYVELARLYMRCDPHKFRFMHPHHWPGVLAVNKTAACV